MTKVTSQALKKVGKGTKVSTFCPYVVFNRG